MQWIKKHKRLTGTVAALSLLILFFWALQSFGGDAQMARVQELKKQLSGEQAKKLAPEQRRDLWKKFNEEVKQLSPAQRRTLAKEREQAMAGKLKNFFALSKAQQRSQLDRDIDRMEAARKKGDQKGFGTNGPSGAGGGPGGKGKGLDAQQREHLRKERLEQTSPEFRAMSGEYFRLLRERREQRGVPPGKGPGR